MAYMSLMKGLDEKAKKKDLDNIFLKLDKNQNGTTKKLEIGDFKVICRKNLHK